MRPRAASGRRRAACWILAPAAAAALATAEERSSRVEVRVDPRVELATIVARLAGASEFNMANSASPYAEDVEKHFGKFREHPAVKLFAELKAQRGVSHDAVPGLAVHLGPLPDLAERLPFDPLPERLDARWGTAGARDFAARLRDFARVSRAEEFFARHRPLGVPLAPYAVEFSTRK